MIISVSFSLFLSFCASAVFLLYPCALVLLFFSFFFFFLPLFLSLSTLPYLATFPVHCKLTLFGELYKRTRKKVL